MIDVSGDDGTSTGDFIAHKLSGDVSGNGSAVRLSRMDEVEGVPRCRPAVMNRLEGFFAAEIFSDSDKLHLRGNDSLLGIPHLGDGMTAGSLEGFSFEAGVFFEAVFFLLFCR